MSKINLNTFGGSDYNEYTEEGFMKAFPEAEYNILSEDALSKFDNDIQSALKKAASGSISQEVVDSIEKAQRDRSKLVLVTITRKDGRVTKKWVKPKEGDKAFRNSGDKEAVAKVEEKYNPKTYLSVDKVISDIDYAITSRRDDSRINRLNLVRERFISSNININELSKKYISLVVDHARTMASDGFGYEVGSDDYDEYVKLKENQAKNIIKLISSTKPIVWKDGRLSGDTSKLSDMEFSTPKSVDGHKVGDKVRIKTGLGLIGMSNMEGTEVEVTGFKDTGLTSGRMDLVVKDKDGNTKEINPEYVEKKGGSDSKFYIGSGSNTGKDGIGVIEQAQGILDKYEKLNSNHGIKVGEPFQGRGSFKGNTLQIVSSAGGMSKVINLDTMETFGMTNEQLMYQAKGETSSPTKEETKILRQAWNKKHRGK